MRSWILRFAAIALLVGLPSAVSTPRAEACSCSPPSPLSGLAAADAVFIGKAVANRPGDAVEMEVSRIWKGAAETATVIHSYGATCGVALQLGREYLIYAFREEEGLTTGMCLAFRVDLHDVRVRELSDAVGPGVTLASDDDALDSWGVGLIGVAGGFVLASAMFAAIFRRRTRQT